VKRTIPIAARNRPVGTSRRGPRRGNRTVLEAVEVAIRTPIIDKNARPVFTGV